MSIPEHLQVNNVSTLQPAGILYSSTVARFLRLVVAGRFSEVFLRTTTGVLHSVDYSNSVDANLRNNLSVQRLKLVQASIYELPFADNTFDKVFCLGVFNIPPHLPIRSLRSLVKLALEVRSLLIFILSMVGYQDSFEIFTTSFVKHLPKSLFLGDSFKYILDVGSFRFIMLKWVSDSDSFYTNNRCSRFSSNSQ